ncbi:hypothetical protein MMC18_002367 [Xylographa bjoerkii]|nr:hypothetical protein [Xylographa bjoerkii]
MAINETTAMAPMSMPATAPGIRIKRGRHTPVETVEELGNTDVEDELVCVRIAGLREELGNVDSEDGTVCTGAVEAVVRVKELCDEPVADAK